MFFIVPGIYPYVQYHASILLYFDGAGIGFLTAFLYMNAVDVTLGSLGKTPPFVLFILLFNSLEHQVNVLLYATGLGTIDLILLFSSMKDVSLAFDLKEVAFLGSNLALSPLGTLYAFANVCKSNELYMKSSLLRAESLTIMES